MLLRRMFVFALFALPLSVWAHDYRIGPLQIGHPYARPTPPAARTGAAYLSIRNEGTTPDRLIGASSEIAASVELHHMLMEGNIVRMRPVQAVAVPAGAAVDLRPGGMHIMLQGIKRPLRSGERFPLTLRFEKAGQVMVEVKVEAGSEGGHAQHPAH